MTGISFELDTGAIEKDLVNGVWLFGAGVNGIWCKDYLETHSYIVKGFIDNNPLKIDTIISEKKCISWAEFEKNHKGELIFVTARHCFREIMESIQYNKAFSFDKWYLACHEKEYSALLFFDEKSNSVLRNIMAAMFSGDESKLYEICDQNQYFDIAPFFNCGGEHYVDIGGYVGDTVEDFIRSQNGEFERIYAFEPCTDAYNAMCIRCERLKKEWVIPDEKISLLNLGVLEKSNKNIGFSKETNLQSSFLDLSKEGTVCTVSMDEFFADKKITFIKADIEGMEMTMLKGAVNVIKKNKPKMALCVYHRPDDLINIYDFVKKLVPEYKVSLRHYSPKLMETVMYFYI